MGGYVEVEDFNKVCSLASYTWKVLLHLYNLNSTCLSCLFIIRRTSRGAQADSASAVLTETRGCPLVVYTSSSAWTRRGSHAFRCVLSYGVLILVCSLYYALRYTNLLLHAVSIQLFVLCLFLMLVLVLIDRRTSFHHTYSRASLFLCCFSDGRIWATHSSTRRPCRCQSSVPSDLRRCTRARCGCSASSSRRSISSHGTSSWIGTCSNGESNS